MVNVPMGGNRAHRTARLSGAARQTYKDTLGLWLPVRTDRLRLDSPGGVLSAQHYELGYRCRYNKRGKIVELTHARRPYHIRRFTCGVIGACTRWRR